MSRTSPLLPIVAILATFSAWTSSAFAVPTVPVGKWTRIDKPAVGLNDDGWTSHHYSSALHGVLAFANYKNGGGEDQNTWLVFNLDTASWTVLEVAEQCGSANLSGTGHDEGNSTFDPLHGVLLSKGALTLGCHANRGTWEYDVRARAGRHIRSKREYRYETEASGSFDTDKDAWIVFGLDPSPTPTYIYEHATHEWTAYPSAIPARTAHAQVYDSAKKKTVLFGGSGRSDTWTFDFSTKNWSAVASTVVPGPLGTGGSKFPHMAYDENRKVTLLVGTETWSANLAYELDLDKGWTRTPAADLPPEIGPGAGGLGSGGSRLVYDPDDQLYLFVPGNALQVWAYRAAPFVAGDAGTDSAPIGDPDLPDGSPATPATDGSVADSSAAPEDGSPSNGADPGAAPNGADPGAASGCGCRSTTEKGGILAAAAIGAALLAVSRRRQKRDGGVR